MWIQPQDVQGHASAVERFRKDSPVQPCWHAAIILILLFTKQYINHLKGPSTCKDKNMKLMFRLATIWGSYVSHTCSWLPCSPSIPSLPLFYLPKIPPSCVLHSNPRKCSCPCLTLASYYASHCQSLYECYRGDHWYFLAATYRLAGNDGIICSIVAEWMRYLGKIASLTSYLTLWVLRKCPFINTSQYCAIQSLILWKLKAFVCGTRRRTEVVCLKGDPALSYFNFTNPINSCSGKWLS